MQTVNAAIVQWDVALGRVEENVDKALSMLKGLAVDLALLPEMWSCGFDNEHLAEHGRKTPAVLDRISSLAAEKNMAVGGTLPERVDGRVANTFYLVGPKGRLLAFYRKIHLFTPGHEDRYFAAGGEVVTADLPWGRVGLVTCYDLRFPELSRCLVLNGAEVLLVSAQWPKVRSAHWDVLLKARAVENQMYVLAANRCGRDPHQEYAGHSRIVSPWGDCLGMVDDDEAVLSAKLDAEALERARTTIPCLSDRRPSVYRHSEPGGPND